MSKLSLDRDKIDQAKKLAEQIISPVSHFIERHTTVSIERCVLRLLGVSGVADENLKGKAPQGRYPLVNEVIDKIGREALARGAGYWFGLASAHNPRLNPETLARKIVSGEINLKDLERLPKEKIDGACQRLLRKQLDTLRSVREAKKNKRPPWKNKSIPLKYVIVATGNIHEDIVQAQAAAEMGADIIAVIRSTAQSLLDHVPEGETTEGFGGTFATQDNFRLMRQALDQTEKKIKRRVALTNYSSGLCMPEIAVIGALEGVDYLLNDAMYGVLFRDINMKRNFVDQHFSRRICALSGITIQTGEDNYLTTAESFKYWYQVLASHFINQAFAKKAGLGDSFLALGHAFEMDPEIEDSIMYELAQAQLVRELFPRCPIKFMPPTKHKSGDIFFGYLYDAMFNLAGAITGQNIQLLGMHTEAIHNPFLQDRFLSLKNANYIFNAAKSARDEILFQPNGKIARRARQVLDDASRLLKKIRLKGLFGAIEEGAFANVRRSQKGGRGLEGILSKDRSYYTPLHQYLTPRTAGEYRERSYRHGQRPARKYSTLGVTRKGVRDRGREIEKEPFRSSSDRPKVPSKPRKPFPRRELSEKKPPEKKPVDKRLSEKKPPEKKPIEKKRERKAPVKPPVSESSGPAILLPPPHDYRSHDQLQRQFHLEQIKAQAAEIESKEIKKEKTLKVVPEKEKEAEKVPEEKQEEKREAKEAEAKAPQKREPLPRRPLKVTEEKVTEEEKEGEDEKAIKEEKKAEPVPNEKKRLPRRPLSIDKEKDEAKEKPSNDKNQIDEKKAAPPSGDKKRLPRRQLKISEKKEDSATENKISRAPVKVSEKKSLEPLPRRQLVIQKEEEKKPENAPATETKEKGSSENDS